VSTNGKTASLRRPNKSEQSRETDTTKLARLISAYAPHDGVFELRIPGVHASRLSRFNRECVHTLRLPCLSIIAQGAKTIIVGQEVYEYDPSRMLVYSVALPVAAQVTQASYSEPYLALRLDLEPQKIAEGVSARCAHSSRKKRGLHHSGRPEHCQRRDQVNGMSRAARGR
jgi:hypothetical protein